MGSQATNVIASSCASASFSTEGVTPEEVATMKATIEALKDEMHQKEQKWQEELQLRDQQMEEKFQKMMQQYLEERFANKNFGLSSSGSASKLRPTVEDGCDDDTSDGVDSDD